MICSRRAGRAWVFLQITQAFRIRRRHIYRGKIRVGGADLQDFNIVIGGGFAILIRTQINAENTVFRAGFFSRSAMVFAPSLLNPNRLMIALSLARRNSRGLGLPFWGRGVIAPTSIKPKPLFNRGFIARAFLSSPAANPIGFGIVSPAKVVRNRWRCDFYTRGRGITQGE